MKRTWTDEEIEYLKEAWGNIRIEIIRRKLNKRTITAIRLKAKRLGLGGAKANGYKYITAGQVAKILGEDRKTIWKWIQKGKIKAKLQTISGEQKWWCIDFEYFIKWLQENQQMYDATKIEQYALGYEYDWLIEKRKRDRERSKK